MTTTSLSRPRCTVCPQYALEVKSFEKILHFQPEKCRKTTVHALVTSQLDYSNSLYLGLPAYLVLRLQIIQNAVARLIRNVPLHHHISPHSRHLLCLPVNRRIEFKALTLAYRATRYQGPGYLRQRLQIYQQDQALRSNHLRLLRVPRFLKARIGGRAFTLKTAKL